ncbi:putative Porin/voltage-dependent anion-selective channel protein [Tripterygium wilfordii]|uniref:Putative Porin/voltage-dependent anion-selective channel protein n=1 Tax=Tripterygium wilfordii TaxID=458696 RepID=A0A7J7CGN3_TRIWF|nr:putative Porin/voltage-dependent anion-selective channel protein [Tripterygium wilfordii]
MLYTQRHEYLKHIDKLLVMLSHSQTNASYVFLSLCQNSATLSFSGNLLPSTKFIASAKFPNYKTSMLKIQYLGFHKHSAVTISVVLNQLPSANLSATLNISSIAIGMKATYKTSSSQFAAYDAGISVTKPICDASIILADKGDLIRASFVHYFDQGRKIAAVAEITRRFSKKENNLTVGGSCSVDHHTTIKAKLDNHGKLNALLMHKFKPKSYLTISGEFNTIALDKHPKIGLALALSL